MIHHPDTVIAARKFPGTGLSDTEDQLDMKRLRAYRLGRIREQLKQNDYAGCVLFDPINIRYATGSRNCQIWALRHQARYVFVPAEGPVVLFDMHGGEPLVEGLETIDEVRPAVNWAFTAAGSKVVERAKRWAQEIDDLLRQSGGNNRRVAIDKVNPWGAEPLKGLGCELFDGIALAEQARSIKSAEEMACILASLAVCEAGFTAMREALTAGLREIELWSILHETNIRLGGEYIETRMLTSGARTNPWFQEATDRVIRPGELVACDADLIGPFGYFADISRTFFCEPGRPSAEQRRLYGLAHEQIHHNIDLLKPGMTFREYSEKSWRLPEPYVANRYTAVLHGAGLAGEYPFIAYPHDFPTSGYDGRLEENMTLCIESYVGAEGGEEGVKLEQLVVITKDGAKPLSTFPFEDVLLS